MNKAVTILFLSFSLLLVVATAAEGHSWYSPGCCHDRDCYPAKMRFNVELDRLEGFSRLRQSWLPLEHSLSQILPSQDAQYHVCDNSYRENNPGYMYFRCVYVPSAS